MLKQDLAAARTQWGAFSFYQKFEHGVIMVLTGLIAVIVVFAVWNLMLKVVTAILLSGGLDPTEYSVFQTLFGMIFTIIIALEFKRSLLVVAERRNSIVQVRTVVLIGILAIVRKLLILDLTTTDALQLFALAAAILALGSVFWMVRQQDRYDHALRALRNSKLQTPAAVGADSMQTT